MEDSRLDGKDDSSVVNSDDELVAEVLHFSF
jgi:hypothetical protein